MDNLALLMTLTFVFLTIVLSYWLKIGLEKEIIIGTIRAGIQLLVIGFILHTIFSLQSWVLIVLMIGFMILIAALTASKKGKGIKRRFLRIAIAISVTEMMTMGLLLGLNIIKPEPQFIIPISGMIIGNGMVVSSLFLNRLKSELDTKRDQILLYLSLGASAKQAFSQMKKIVVKASMLPTIDSMKTVGLVQLPGMMTGMIIAGASPIDAVRYQILIMYSFAASATITSILLAILFQPLIFNHSHQLVEYDSYEN